MRRVCLFAVAVSVAAAAIFFGLWQHSEKVRARNEATRANAAFEAATKPLVRPKKKLHPSVPSRPAIPPLIPGAILPPPIDSNPRIASMPLQGVDTLYGFIEVTATVDLSDSSISFSSRVIAPPTFFAPPGATKRGRAGMGLLVGGHLKPDAGAVLALNWKRLYLGLKVSGRGGGVFAGVLFDLRL